MSGIRFKMPKSKDAIALGAFDTKSSGSPGPKNSNGFDLSNSDSTSAANSWTNAATSTCYIAKEWTDEEILDAFKFAGYPQPPGFPFDWVCGTCAMNGCSNAVGKNLDDSGYCALHHSVGPDVPLHKLKKELRHFRGALKKTEYEIEMRRGTTHDYGKNVDEWLQDYLHARQGRRWDLRDVTKYIPKLEIEIPAVSTPEFATKQTLLNDDRAVSPDIYKDDRSSKVSTSDMNLEPTKFQSTSGFPSRPTIQALQNVPDASEPGQNVLVDNIELTKQASTAGDNSSEHVISSLVPVCEEDLEDGEVQEDPRIITARQSNTPIPDIARDQLLEVLKGQEARWPKEFRTNHWIPGVCLIQNCDEHLKYTNQGSGFCRKHFKDNKRPNWRSLYVLYVQLVVEEEDSRKQKKSAKSSKTCALGLKHQRDNDPDDDEDPTKRQYPHDGTRCDDSKRARKRARLESHPARNLGTNSRHVRTQNRALNESPIAILGKCQPQSTEPTSDKMRGGKSSPDCVPQHTDSFRSNDSLKTSNSSLSPGVKRRAAEEPEENRTRQKLREATTDRSVWTSVPIPKEGIMSLKASKRKPLQHSNNNVIHYKPFDANVNAPNVPGTSKTKQELRLCKATNPTKFRTLLEQHIAELKVLEAKHNAKIAKAQAKAREKKDRKDKSAEVLDNKPLANKKRRREESEDDSDRKSLPKKAKMLHQVQNDSNGSDRTSWTDESLHGSPSKAQNSSKETNPSPMKVRKKPPKKIKINPFATIDWGSSDSEDTDVNALLLQPSRKRKAAPRWEEPLTKQALERRERAARRLRGEKKAV